MVCVLRPMLMQNRRCPSGHDSLRLPVPGAGWVWCTPWAGSLQGSTIQTGHATSTNVSAVIRVLSGSERRNLVQIIP